MNKFYITTPIYYATDKSFDFAQDLLLARLRLELP